jgi:hypothetical protein
MKLIELYNQIGELLERCPDSKDLLVSIPNKVTGAIGLPTITVKHGAVGFDWSSGKFLIYPQSDMIAKEHVDKEIAIRKIVKKVPQTNKTRHMKIADIKRGRKK